MIPIPHRLVALVGLFALAACDGGSAPPKDAAPPKTAAAPKAEPTKAAPAPDVTASTPDAKVEPAPAPDLNAEPTPPEPAPTTAVDPAADVADPSQPADPAADPVADPAADPATDVADPDEPTDEPAAAAGDGSAPIALGPDAELLQLVLAHDVVDRKPVDPATTFPPGHKVNLFIEARNESEEEIRVRVTWETVSTGRRTPPVGVVIPTRKLHRTRAYRTMKKAGEYRCIVLGEDDSELAVLPFTIG